MSMMQTYSVERVKQLDRMAKRLVRQDNRDAKNNLRLDALRDLRAEPNRFMQHVGMTTPTDCWPWSGPNGFNHPEAYRERFLESYFTLCSGREMATHVMCFLAYDRMVPDGLDITPTCGDHLCMNPAHFLVTNHGASGEQKQLYGEPAREFLCREVRAR